MNLVKTIEQYKDTDIIFCDPIKNNIMCDGNFIRILYSTPYIVLNGIYLLVKLHDVTCERYYNKYKCTFSTLVNKDIVENLKSIEERILYMYKTNKTPCFKVYEQIKSGYIKIFTDVGNVNQCSCVLKISGIWETPINYGLTYKFMKVV